MTKKRFKLLYSKLDNGMFIDKEKKFDDIFVDKEFQKIGLIKIVDLLNTLDEENQLLKEEKELLKNKLDRIADILPHYLSCAEISNFKSKTHKEDIALMKCWNKRYQK